MKAIILAAGRGSRMKNLTDEIPKCMLEFRGKPLIEWQLASLRSAGIDEIGIVTGYKKEITESFGLSCFHNEKWSDTNMLYSLYQARDWLLLDDCIVTYSDIFYTEDSIVPLLNTKPDICITYDPNWLEQWSKRFADPLEDAETFNQENGWLTDIGRQPKSLNEINGQYMGIIGFSPKGWKQVEDFLRLLPNGFDHLDMTSLLSKLIQRNISIQTIPIATEWYEFDSMNDLEKIS